jgi:hypothetical protein
VPDDSHAPTAVTLKVTFRELAEGSLQDRWRGKIPDADIMFAMQTGIAPGDVNVLRTFSARRYLFVVRCPKRAGLALQGVLAPKPAGVKGKSSEASGTLKDNGGRLVVSDIDPMSLWKGTDRGWVRVPCGGPSGTSGSWGSEEADRVMQELLPKMTAPFQHGCQDDWRSKDNPGVKQSAKGEEPQFAAFLNGTAKHLPSCGDFFAFHTQQGIVPPYDPKTGAYTGAA